MISKNEIPKVGYINKDGIEFAVITANQTETQFFFYEFDGNEYKKLGKANSPPELEKRFNIKERMGIKK